MNICIRTDASAAIGAGHLMRCLALAGELAQRGAAVSFATRAERIPWGELVEAHGHRVLPLPAADDDWRADLQDTREALGGATVDWLIVDHYGLGYEWEEGMRSHARRLFAIDDLRRAHACDLLLDQNTVAGADAGLPAGEALLGPRYALLRPEFAQARQGLRKRDGRCRRVLINFGGSDPAGETERAIEGFLAADLPQATAAVILGSANPRAADLRRRYGSHPRLEVVETTDRMAELMAAADIAIGAGGISTWERASLALPSLVVAIADNQVGGAEALGARGCHLYLGRSGEVDAAYLAAAVAVLARNAGLMSSLSQASGALCDGLGARRVADRILPPRLQLKPATAADSAALHEWRNAEPIRTVSGNAQPIDRATHDRWFQQVLADDTRHLLIGKDERGPVGVVRFDVADDCANISIYLVPERIGSGLGSPLLLAAQNWLAEHIPAIAEIRAKVLAGNARSAAMFEHAGYRLRERQYCKSRGVRTTQP